MADLTVPAGLMQYLANTQFAAADVQKLAGGYEGFMYRVVLKTPLPTGETSVVVKHGRGYLASDRGVVLAAEQMEFEYEALKMIYNSPSLSTLDSTVQVPRVLHYDPNTHTLIMSDPAAARMLPTMLIEALESGDPSRVCDLTSRIGSALGDFMGRFHEWGSLPEQTEVRARFMESAMSRDEMLRFRYRLMLATAEKYGIKESWMDQMMAEGMRNAQEGGNVIEMADFWLDNIMVSENPLRVHIIDCGTVRCARHELDVAQFMTSAYKTVNRYPGTGHNSLLMQSFVESYTSHFVLVVERASARITSVLASRATPIQC